MPAVSPAHSTTVSPNISTPVSVAVSTTPISTRRTTTKAWLATLLLLIAVARPALAAPPDVATLRPQLEQLLAARVPAAGSGVVLLVARGDTVLYRSARCMA